MLSTVKSIEFGFDNELLQVDVTKELNRLKNLITSSKERLNFFISKYGHRLIALEGSWQSWS